LQKKESLQKQKNCDTLRAMKTIWYKNPAASADDAIPAGNGRLGAKIFGGTGSETILLFEESVWSGAFSDRNNRDAVKNLPLVRTLLNQNREDEAQEKIYECFSGTPSEQNFYRDAGKISIDFYDEEHRGLFQPEGGSRNFFSAVESYRREIDLQDGIFSAGFSVETDSPSTADLSNNTTGSSISFRRECFVSSSADVIVYHISASTPKSIFLRAEISSGGCVKKSVLTNDTIVSFDTAGVPFATMMTAVASGGTIFTRGENLIVEKADEVTLYIDVETAFRNRGYRKSLGNLRRRPLSLALRSADSALKKICFASGTSYENLRTEHMTEFSSWWIAGNLICPEDADEKSFDEILKNPALVQSALWNFSKYSLISSCNRRSTLPSVKNGIWAAQKSARFSLSDSGIFRKSCGMFGEEKMNLPLFDLAKKIFYHGKITAEKMYGISGFAAHNSTDIWGDTVPCGRDLRSSYSPLGSIKIAESVLEYFEFSLDKKFLRKNFYLVKEACNFFAEYLVPVEEKKFLVMCPSFSDGTKNRDGETVYALTENESDSEKIRELFLCELKALKFLGVKNSSEKIVECNSVLERLKNSSAEKTVQQKNDFADFDGNLCAIADGIVSSRITQDLKIEISLLKNTGAISSGKLERIFLKGNVFADVEWRDGKFLNAKLFTEPGTDFIKKVAVLYDGKKYDTQLSSDGTLDLRNVFPSTI
jgi:alpha-L-fucosidase 2